MNETPAPVVVQAHGLHHRFGERDVLRDVSLVLREGEVTGFVGHNGAGKSTTMRILAGIVTPTQGDVTIHGVPASLSSSRMHVGMLPEEPPLSRDLTVVEQLRFAASLRGLSGRTAAREVERVVGRCDLIESQRRLCGVLSKGTRQRVGLAQALLGAPSVLLLDEPAAGLDPTQAEALRVLVRELAREGAAVLLSTHIVADVVPACDRALVLARGRVVANGPAREIMQRDDLLSLIAGTAEGAA